MREVRAASLLGFVEVAYFLGLDPFRLMRRAAISPSFLDDPENRRAAGPVTQMLEDAAADSGCAHFGLLMAECRTFASIGPLSLLLQHLSNAGEVLSALNDYRHLMNDVVTLEGIKGQESSAFCWIFAPGFEHAQTVGLTVGLGYRILAEVLGGRWSPKAVHFRCSPPSDLKPIERFFAVPVEFDSKFNGYSCSTASLDTSVPTAEPTMADHARRLLDMIPSISEQASVSNAAQRAISLLLPTGSARLTTVASNLGMNARMLQRRLALEGSSFERILTSTRKDIAIRLLTGSDRPIGFISEMLGYSSTGAFTRWFSSEYGHSPSEWRRSQQRGP